MTKSLSEKAQSLKINLKDKVKQVNNIKTEEDPLISFNNIEGNSYNPQVYIPYYEELKNSSKIGAKDPILVIFNGKKKEKEDGYIFVGNKLTKLPFLIDEEYTKLNEVWVLSINERTGGA